ncbi:MAG: sugar transferase [Elusimicrobiota bacterium]
MTDMKPSHLLKHAVDRLLAAAVLIAGLPLFALLIAAIVAEDLLSGEGLMTPFFREPRLSGGRKFIILKFRILRPSAVRKVARGEAGAGGYIKALEHDPESVSRIGALLRDYYFDELPQVVNILKGEMSFVGPRPIPLKNDPLRLKLYGKTAMRCGLTGIHQLGKGSARSQDEMDEEYRERWETLSPLRLLAYDAGIMFRTIFKVSKGEGI